jgi:beta-xylosidase
MIGVRGQKSEVRSQRSEVRKIGFLFSVLCLLFSVCFAQQSDDLEFTLDVTSNTIPLPKIFKPNIDLSGRGFNREVSWPQTIAAKEVLDTWQKDIGFSGFYRIQYNLWEINQLSKDKEAQNKLLSNYDNIIKNINDAGGIVILDIFGTPAGLGKVLDKKSTPWDLKAFKALVKGVIRDLSCNKRYNIWYEVWNAPDLDDFFLGRKQEYLNLYRQVAESINELKLETKLHIPLGGPSVSWLFSNFDGNTILTPEKSLIYELIKFCYHYRLPLDFITWHGFSANPGAEKENTIYKKTAVNLIRDWLTYLNFDRNTPLIVDEWNFDRDANILPQRQENSYICASFIPSRLKNMYEAGIDYQLYFCLEDFQNNKEGVVRNVGIFSFDPEHSEYKGAPKSIYNVFRMLSNLGNDMFLSKLDDEFVGVIATKSPDSLAMLIFNYIAPDIVMDYLSKNIANLNGAERKSLLSLIKSQKLEKIILHQLDISSLRGLTNKLKNILKKAQELNDLAKRLGATGRNIKIGIKNLKENYLYERYAVDSACSLRCEFAPVEKKELNTGESYQETLTLNPYSVNMIMLKKKPKEPENIQIQTGTQPAQNTISQGTNAPAVIKEKESGTTKKE